jgi:peptide/nickel transport system permease protein
MTGYVLARMLASVPVLAFVALFIFLLVHLAPGDPAALIAGDSAGVQEIAAIREKLNLDAPLHIQFGTWVAGLAQGDLGVSIFSSQPVARLIVQRVEPTLLLALYTIIVSLLIAIPLGVVAAMNRRSWIDTVAMLVSMAGFSVPVFVIGYGLMFLFSMQLGWLPVQGYKPVSAGLAPHLASLALPTVSLAFVFSALIARITRGAMIEVLCEDYVRTARAKGLGLWRVVVIHALKNAGVPIATVTGIGFAILISGVVVTESVFNIPGLGRLTVDAILRRDYPIVQGVILFFSLVLVVVNILVDLSYALFDPRIRMGRSQ